VPARVQGGGRLGEMGEKGEGGGGKGMLQVHLVRVAGLRSEDLIGHSDPYVILRVSSP
jgi:hypothetical protein